MERLSARDNGVLRVGILGGSFDPPHIGHLILAEEARDQLGLDKVLFAPAGQQPLKQGQKVTAAEDRVRMTELAIASRSSRRSCRATRKSSFSWDSTACAICRSGATRTS